MKENSNTKEAEQNAHCRKTSKVNKTVQIPVGTISVLTPPVANS